MLFWLANAPPQRSDLGAVSSRELSASTLWKANRWPDNVWPRVTGPRVSQRKGHCRPCRGWWRVEASQCYFCVVSDAVVKQARISCSMRAGLGKSAPSKITSKRESLR